MRTTSASGHSLSIELVPMATGRDAEFAGMIEEFKAAGELHVYTGIFAIAWKGYGGYYDLLSKMKAGGYPQRDFVPMDPYFIESEGQILGEVLIRRGLTPHLEKIGGHVGYKVRPSARNRGVATAALRLALEKLRSMGIERALVTCNTTNSASARVIEKCGGARIEDAQLPDRVERRYRVSTAL